MKRRLFSRRVFLIALAALCGAAAAQARGRKPVSILFTVDPSTVTAGRTLTVRCESSVPLKNTALYFKNRKAVFYPEGAALPDDETPIRLRAFLGISSLEDPGPKNAKFYAELPKGKVFQSTVAFTVEAGTYPVSRVNISKEKDKIISTGKLEEDALVLDKIYRAPIAGEKLWDGFFIVPTTGIPSSPFGARRRYGDRENVTAHTGWDIANAVGTPIFAANRGRVVFARWLDSFGNTVLLDHGLGVFSYYLHMIKSHVKEGDLLEKNAPVGDMGAEGLVTGPHLHWSFVVAGERVEPREWTEKEFK